VAGAQHGRLVERPADELQADGIAAAEAATATKCERVPLTQKTVAR
jgi:hypothetical protein